MISIKYIFIEIFIGLSSGIAVGSGLVAFLSVLGLIPRLFQILNNKNLIEYFSLSAVLSSVFGSFISFHHFTLYFSNLFSIIWGLFHGLFIGMLIGALAEVLNVFPLILKRLRLFNFLEKMLVAIICGKILGSLFQWLVLVKL